MPYYSPLQWIFFSLSFFLFCFQLKQHTFIILRVLKVKNLKSVHQDKFKLLAGLFPCRGCERIIHFLTLFSFSWLPVFLGLWPPPPFSKCIPPVFILSHCFLIISSQTSFCLPLYKHVWLHWRLSFPHSVLSFIICSI